MVRVEALRVLLRAELTVTSLPLMALPSESVRVMVRVTESPMVTEFSPLMAMEVPVTDTVVLWVTEPAAAVMVMVRLV